MLIKSEYRLKGLKVDESVPMFKYWNESFMYGITDKWEDMFESMIRPSTAVNIEDVFIHAHPGNLKTRTSRNPMAGWVGIISCDRERFVEDLKGVI